MRPGYILIEMVIALTIFAIAALGLANSLGTSLQAANLLNRENTIRIGMRSFIEELRRKPLADMSTTIVDEALGVTYTSVVDESGIATSSGRTLNDLYTLTVTASYSFGAEPLTDDVSVILYKPD